MDRAVVPLNFNAFLEKAKLKDDGSNYTDWVRNLRIIIIAAQKNYVLEAGAEPGGRAGAWPPQRSTNLVAATSNCQRD